MISQFIRPTNVHLRADSIHSEQGIYILTPLYVKPVQSALFVIKRAVKVIVSITGLFWIYLFPGICQKFKLKLENISVIILNAPEKSSPNGLIVK